MARTGRNGAPWTLLDGALHRLKDEKLKHKIYRIIQLATFKVILVKQKYYCFLFYMSVNKAGTHKQTDPDCCFKNSQMKTRYDSLDEVVYCRLSVACHINQPLQMLCPPDGKYHLGICV